MVSYTHFQKNTKKAEHNMKNTSINENNENECAIILASASPRRREILAELGLSFRVITADTDESCELSDPREYAMELARRKGHAVYKLLCGKHGKEYADGLTVLSADTVVVCDGEILGKPTDRADAIRMLRMLRGRAHSVITGVGVTYGGITHTDLSETLVYVDEIPDAELEAYVDTGDPMDKAGSYGIQGIFSRWITGIDGCYFGVVGLPTNKLASLYFRVTGKELLGAH